MKEINWFLHICMYYIIPPVHDNMSRSGKGQQFRAPPKIHFKLRLSHSQRSPVNSVAELKPVISSELIFNSR